MAFINGIKNYAHFLILFEFYFVLRVIIITYSMFLDLLKNCGSVAEVCHVFIKNSVGFLEVYSLYCQNYPKSVMLSIIFSTFCNRMSYQLVIIDMQSIGVDKDLFKGPLNSKIFQNSTITAKP